MSRGNYFKLWIYMKLITWLFPFPFLAFILDCWPDFPERDIWWVSGREGYKWFLVRFRHHFLPPEPGVLAWSLEGFWAERKHPECDFFFSYWAFHIYVMHIFHLSNLLICLCSGSNIFGCSGKREMQKTLLARENPFWRSPTFESHSNHWDIEILFLVSRFYC